MFPAVNLESTLAGLGMGVEEDAESLLEAIPERAGAVLLIFTGLINKLVGAALDFCQAAGHLEVLHLEGALTYDGGGTAVGRVLAAATPVPKGGRYGHQQTFRNQLQCNASINQDGQHRVIERMMAEDMATFVRHYALEFIRTELFYDGGTDGYKRGRITIGVSIHHRIVIDVELRHFNPHGLNHFLEGWYTLGKLSLVT